MRSTLLALGATLMATAIGLVSAPAAYACGGFFCNRDAIDQSGENILFSYNEDGTVTTMVQIAYQGPSDQFAWILPVPAEPQVAIGTDAVFAQLALMTSPVFTTRSEMVGSCRGEPTCEGAHDFDRGGYADASAAADGGTSLPGVDVRLRANVGPYDVAVLASGSAEALRVWLDDNGYLIPESALAEIDHYVALNHFFVALRLQKNRSAGEIQPIVLTSSNDEPCIPLRLTRIASTPDMPVVAYFLGDRRTRPVNYMLVEPDFEEVGLWTGELSYRAYVTRIVDDAGGHAFVTDYAGDTPRISIEVSDIEDLRTQTDPARFLSDLQSRGFNGDSQLLSILLRFLPPPEDWDAQSFYNCLTQGWCSDEVNRYVADLSFAPDPLVDALIEGIVTPRREAQALVESAPHLTRLFSTLSPEEMTEDPMFMRSGELARDVSRVHEAVQRTLCGPQYFAWTAPLELVLPSGTVERVREGVPYYGSDAEYCEDRYGGGFYPGADVARLEEVARRRNTRVGGGGAGLCSISPAAGGLGGAAALMFALVALVWRRRR